MNMSFDQARPMALYFATLELASGILQRLEVVPPHLRRFRLEPADAAAREWAPATAGRERVGTQTFIA